MYLEDKASGSGGGQTNRETKLRFFKVNLPLFEANYSLRKKKSALFGKHDPDPDSDDYSQSGRKFLTVRLCPMTSSYGATASSLDPEEFSLHYFFCLRELSSVTDFRYGHRFRGMNSDLFYRGTVSFPRESDDGPYLRSTPICYQGPEMNRFSNFIS